MWLYLAILAAQMFLGEVLRPRPHKTSFEEFQQNNGPSEIRPIPYLAGTEEVTPSRIWYGDFKQRAVERDSQWTDYLFFGLFGALLDTITVAYRYYSGEVFALCYGPDTHIAAVKLDDRPAYVSTLDNAGGSFLIDDPQAWGGDQPPGEGGQYSVCDITRGNFTDPTPAYIQQMLGQSPRNAPALHGVSCLISRGPSGATESGYFAAGGVGFIPRFHEWKVTCRRQPNYLATAYSKINTVHANPAEVIYEWATNIEYGAKLPVTEINVDSFRTAAQTLFNDNLGWSGKIENSTTPFDVCENVAAQIDAVLDPSPRNGLTLRLIRRDYSFASLPILNQSNISKVDRYLPGSYDDTVNKIIVPFGDQNSNFVQRPGIYIDAANQRIQGGRVVPKTQEYIGVGDYETANMLATRDGRALALPRPPLLAWCLPSFGRLRYRGEVVRFDWNDPTFSKVMRVLEISKSTVTDSEYKLTLIEDQFATGVRTFGEPVGTQHEDPAAGLDTEPPSAAWDTALYAPNGLRLNEETLLAGEYRSSITGAIIFGTYAPGGQYARMYVTEPGGEQTLTPMYLSPDANNKAQFTWPAVIAGTYQFCIQTFSLHGVTDGTLMCASIGISSPSVSPSASRSPSHSASPSVSPSVSPSLSVSPSSSSSPSVSPSASASPSGGSPSQSPSSSTSPSVSPSASVSPSLSQSPSASQSSSASLSPSSSASPSPAETFARVTTEISEVGVVRDSVPGNARVTTEMIEVGIVR